MSNNRDQYFSFYKESRFLRYRQFHLQRDILRVAFRMFHAENILKEKGLLEKITIPLSIPTFRHINKKRLIGILKDLFLLILLEDIEIELIETDDFEKRVTKEVDFPKAGVCSFNCVNGLNDLNSRLPL